MSYFGISDVSKIFIDGSSEKNLNWTEVTVPGILTIPTLKPDIESVDQVYADVEITCTKLIETPFAYEEICSCSVASQEQRDQADDLVAAVTALDLDGAFTTAVLTPIGTLLTTITAINLAPLGLSLKPFTDPIQASLDLIEGLITSIDALLTTITTATADASTTICTLTTLFTNLRNLLTSLLAAVTALLQQLNALLGEINRIVAQVPAAALLLGTVLTTLQNLIGTVTPLINALIVSLGQIITDISNFLLTLCPDRIRLLSNEEGTILTGRKLIVEGLINYKVVYTALVATQSVHSAHYSIPFSAYVIPYAKFINMTYNLENKYFSYTPGQAITVDLNENFYVTPYIEDIFVYTIDKRTIFKNTTIFLKVQSQL